MNDTVNDTETPNEDPSIKVTDHESIQEDIDLNSINNSINDINTDNPYQYHAQISPEQSYVKDPKPIAIPKKEPSFFYPISNSCICTCHRAMYINCL